MEFVIALTVLVVFGVLVIRNAVITSRERRPERRDRAATTGDLIRNASLELPAHVHHRAERDGAQHATPN
jgi:hypothetical protein